MRRHRRSSISLPTRSRLTQLTYPNGSIVQRTYTNRSQLHTVKYLGTTVDTRSYDDGGRLNTSTYVNGAVVTFAYQADNLPTSIATTHAGSPNIGTYSYTWDANKNKTGETITSTMSGFGFSTGATGYDDEDRLQTWNRTNGTMNQAWTLSDVGNWDAFTSAGSTWNRTHSNAHEFTGFTGASTGTLAYDVKGNQTSRPSTLSAPALNLDWNFDNQLVGADTNGSAGSLEVTFEYDALGRRVSRSHSSGNVVYVHAGQQVIADYARGTAAASPSYRCVYADYVDEPILRHAGTGTTLPSSGDNALYYHRNQQYSIIGITNAAGTLVERYSYTAYGTLGIYDASGTVRTTSTYANRYTYTGREHDPDLNLYHFRSRWYDPATGGFISRDPLGYVDGMSLYRGYFSPTNLDFGGMIVVTGKAVPNKEKDCFGPAYEVNFNFALSYDAPCEGYLVQKVTYRCNVRECDNEACRFDLNSDDPTKVYWEQWYIEKGKRTPKGITGYTDQATALSLDWYCGSMMATTELRFYCKEETGDLGGINSWSNDTDREARGNPQWDDLKVYRPNGAHEFCDISPGDLHSTDEQPDFWKDSRHYVDKNGNVVFGNPELPIEDGAGRSHSLSFNCCDGCNTDRLGNPSGKWATYTWSITSNSLGVGAISPEKEGQ